ncbi:MAG: hypothetical protein Q9M97_07870 [Candidatus Gracilibacteria bacterium]|nr:hypothetical protein [Candidatus Gracilibacteria bacterium]
MMIYKSKFGNGKDTYYYIDEVDLGGTKSDKHILIKNLTSNYGNGVREKENVDNEMMTYEELYRILQSSKTIKDSSVEFLSEKTFSSNNFESAPEEENIKTETDLKNILNKEGLLDEDLINIPFKDLKFKDKEKNEEFYRFFSNTDDSKHELTFDGSNQQMKYSDFFHELKRTKEKGKPYKLEKKVSGLSDFIENNEFFSKQDVVLHKDGDKLVKSADKDKKITKGIEHFIWDNSETITIKNISENGIEYETGIKKTDEKIKDKKTGKTIKVITNIEQKFSYKGGENSFDNFLLIANKKDVSFKTLDYDSPEVEVKEGGKKPFEEKGSFFGAWFSMSSLSELIQGGEMITNAIKEYFERGNDLKAAKFAQMFGGVLPDEVQKKLRFNTTEKRKEVIEKIFKQLDEDNAADAGEYIINKILNNKHASKEEVFAAIRYMTLKRGSLYGKPFVGRESEYIWYQRLGGDLNSTEFKEWEKKASNKDRENAAVGKKDPSYLTEENLLENVILKRLGKDGKALYPRVEKDFNKYINEGQANRFKKGEDETANAFTVSEKTDNFVGQLVGGEKSRALGAMTKILSKNSNSTSLHFPGFLISMSGYAKNFNPSELNKVVGSLLFYSIN